MNLHLSFSEVFFRVRGLVIGALLLFPAHKSLADTVIENCGTYRVLGKIECGETAPLKECVLVAGKGSQSELGIPLASTKLIFAPDLGSWVEARIQIKGLKRLSAHLLKVPVITLPDPKTGLVKPAIPGFVWVELLKGAECE